MNRSLTPQMFQSMVEFLAKMVENTVLTLSEVEIDVMIKNAVERELIKYGIDKRSNDARIEAVHSSSKTNYLLIGDDD